jgi:FIMAH domain
VPDGLLTNCPRAQASVMHLSLNSGVKDSLTNKLQAARASLARGSSNAARGQLTTFINELHALVLSRRLEDAEADVLISAAQAIINGI